MMFVVPIKTKNFVLGTPWHEGEGTTSLAGVITRRQGKAPVGAWGFRADHVDPRQAEVWGNLQPAWRSTEAFREVYKALGTLIFDEMGMNKMRVLVDVEDEFLAQFLEAFGMTCEAHYVENVLRDKHWHDQLLFSLLQREWPR